MADPFDYLDSRDTADELIAEFGRDASVVRNVASGEPDAPVLTPTPFATKAVRIEFSRKQIQTGNVQDTDERWLVAAGPLAALGLTEFLPADYLRVGSADKPVLRADSLEPGGTVVLFDCWIRF